MFIYYLLHELFELMSVRELAVVHELSEFMAFQKQPMFKVKVQSESSWTEHVHELNYEFSWKSHLLFKNIH